MKEPAKQWLLYADTDRRTCEQLVGTDGLESVVAFHAQQTIEKALKAIIVFRDQTPPQGKEEDYFLGYFEDYPEYMTQGLTEAELKENLIDLYQDLESGDIPYVKRADELIVRE